MKNTIRCCISCILPCGALDVIRIVHASGRVEEITGNNIRAAEVMKAYPKHILKKPTTSAADTCRPAIVVVPPDAELQRGKIYFLIPVVAPTPQPKKKASRSSSPSISSTPTSTSSSSTARRRRREQQGSSNGSGKDGNKSMSMRANLVLSDQYLSEILSEKVISTGRERRSRGRVGVWRPHLESISETISEASSTTQ